MAQAILSPVYSEALKGRLVFLSASFPRADRDARFYATARPFEITDAVLAAAHAILGTRGGILFGGHPTISPLILSVAHDYLPDFPEQERPYVHVYQSEFFENEITDEVKRLEQEGMGVIHRVPAIAGDRERSLERMRTEMLNTKPLAGIFIGGMEGVYREGSSVSEFALFRGICQGRPVYPIGNPGGASRILLESLVENEEARTWDYIRIQVEALRESRPYSLLMNQIVSDIVAHL